VPVVKISYLLQTKREGLAPAVSMRHNFSPFLCCAEWKDICHFMYTYGNACFNL